MAIFQIFTKRQTRQFNIPARFYDSAKAERDDREAPLRRETGISVDTMEFKSSIAGAFCSRLSHRFNKKEDKLNSTLIFLLFAFILTLAI